MKDKNIEEQFEFRSVRTEETEEAAALEQKCFPPNEACAPQFMKERIQAASEIFLVATDRKNGKIAGFLNGDVYKRQVYAFVFLEGITYGFGLWWINYLYVWTVLCFITLVFRKQTSFVCWSIISGFFGLAFGALCSLPYFFISGPSGAFAYWIAGIPSDITHCIGNVFLCLILFKPLHYILMKINEYKS